MLVTLIGRDSQNKLILPQKVSGDWVLYDKITGNRLLNIDGNNGQWIIKSDNNCKIMNDSNIEILDGNIKINKNGKEILENKVLSLNDFFIIMIKNEFFAMFCSAVYEDNYTHLHIKNTSQICIGNEKKCNHIVYDNPIIGKTHAKIFFLNGVYWINNCNKVFNTFVNGKPIYDEMKMLNNGDVISIMGFSIIIMNKDIFINNPLKKVSCNNDYFDLCYESNNQINNKEDEEEYEQYINKNYFLRTPRMQELIEEKNISIIPPKMSDRNKELPIALVMISSLSMGVMTIISIIQAIDNYISKNTTLKSLIFSLAMSGTMLLSTLLIPILNRQYSKKVKKMNEKDTFKKYKKYIQSKADNIENLLEKDKEILYNTYTSTEECVDIVLNKKQRLWERKITDKDFLTVRLGIGDVSSYIKVESSMIEDADEYNIAYKAMLKCIEYAKTLKQVPVLFSFLEKKISALIYKDEESKNRYIQSLLIQLIAFHSYDELKLVFFTNDKKNDEFEFVKMLPHVWNNKKTVRFFANDKESINEISQYMEGEINKKSKKDETHSEKIHKPYYLIICDDYKSVEDLNIIKEVLREEKNIECSILFLTNSLLKLPSECKNFIDITDEDGSGFLFESKNPTQNKTYFKISTSEIFFFDKINSVLSSIPIKYEEEKESQLPNSYTFLEMYNVGNIEQLNILKRWKENDSTISLNAPIGIDSEGRNISLDIHEKYHGPHGLIAGSTGSGKSEFIITYILSLAVNYHPDDVNFVLIDYKGGGLAGAFQRPDVKLPHLIGTITNIDKSSLQRSLESIQSELKRRQVEFNEAKFETGESTIDIYKYQKYYHSGILKKPISHLFIICDEFAELKQQEPEFMDELISVARIGRSLGVHLILATQKPSGVVNEQIRSNMKFGVCLKVQTPGDSKEVIDISDAAKLNRAGQFYFKVGNDDYLVLGQSAWAGALYYPSSEVKKDFDNSIEFISNTGKVLKKVDDIKKNSTESKGEQLSNIVKLMNDLAKKEEIYEMPLWLKEMPEKIYLDDIRKKYNIKSDKDIIAPVIGEYDDPTRQLQNAYLLNLSKGGNCIVYGNAESGKESLISTVIYDIIKNYSSEKVHLYILDFGSEVLKIFKNSNHVGDVIFANEDEKIARFFMMLRKELKDRKQILSDYNGDYNLYIKTTKKIMPNYVIILNNYDAFIENYPSKYDEIIETLLRESLRYGFVFIFTTSTTSGIRYRTQQNFKQKIVLQMNKDDDYSIIFDYLGKKRPARLFGRGLINPEPKTYYEFEFARICDDEIWNEKIRNTIEERNKQNQFKASEIPTVPDIVTINNLESSLENLSKFPIGISNKNITPCLINIKDNFLNIILSNNMEDYKKFILNIIEEIKILQNINLFVLDAEKIIQDTNEELKDTYIKSFKEMNKKKKIKETVFIIIGVDKFINELGGDDLFFESLKNAKKLKNVYYILMDAATKLNSHSYADWYKEYVVENTGVWLGAGVEEQYILKPKSSLYKPLNTIGNSYGYVFNKGKPSLTKILGMKEVGEENE